MRMSEWRQLLVSWLTDGLSSPILGMGTLCVAYARNEWSCARTLLQSPVA